MVDPESPQIWSTLNTLSSLHGSRQRGTAHLWPADKHPQTSALDPTTYWSNPVIIRALQIAWSPMAHIHIVGPQVVCWPWTFLTMEERVPACVFKCPNPACTPPPSQKKGRNQKEYTELPQEGGQRSLPLQLLETSPRPGPIRVYRAARHRQAD